MMWELEKTDEWVDICEKHAEALQEIERLQSAHQWQTIETAPKDGTRIMLFGRLKTLGCADGEGPSWCSARWAELMCWPAKEGWLVCEQLDGYETMVEDPTAWMPLLLPPEQDGT